MLSIGIVGLPNVGKSSLFKALTKLEVAIANYPFTTINPNVGLAAVPDERLQQLGRVFPHSKIIPAAIEFIDIAGLVKDAHQGAGLGNQFLAKISEVHTLIHVVRAFENPNVPPLQALCSPDEEIEIIQKELSHAGIVKPTLYLFNTDEREKYHFFHDREKSVIVPGEGNAIILNVQKELEKPEKIFELIKKAYKLLGLITFFSVKSGEVRAWAISQGTKTPQAGGKIHSDFEQKFIRAEVINWQKLVEAGGWHQVKAKGRITVKGKDYVIQDGDVIEFKV